MSGRTAPPLVSNAPYVLTTPRLGLRRFVESDASRLAGVFDDPEAHRFYPAMCQPEALERWVSCNLRNYAEHGFGLYALELLDSGQFVGDAGVTWQTVEGQRIHEIGWHIHADHRGRGYATEAGRASLRYAFDSIRSRSVGSIVDPRNAASRVVASRVHQASREFEGKAGRMLLYWTEAGGVDGEG